MFWSNCSYALSYGKHKKINNYWCFIEKIWQDIFFYKGFLHRHWRFTGQQGKGGAIFYSTLPLPLAHKHWDIYLQLCMWDEYHIFLITTLVFARLLLDEIYHLIGFTMWVIDWSDTVSLLTWWTDTRFLLQRFDIGNWWIWTRIDYHPSITSEPTNEVC